MSLIGLHALAKNGDGWEHCSGNGNGWEHCSGNGWEVFQGETL